MFRTATINKYVAITVSGAAYVGSVKINGDQRVPTFAPALSMRDLDVLVSDNGYLGGLEFIGVKNIDAPITIKNSGNGGQIGDTVFYADADDEIIMTSISVSTVGSNTGSVGLVSANGVRRIKSGATVEGDSKLLGGLKLIGSSAGAEVGVNFKWTAALGCLSGECACPTSWSLAGGAGVDVDGGMVLQLVGFDNIAAGMGSATLDNVLCNPTQCAADNTEQFRGSGGLDICREATPPCQDGATYQTRALTPSIDRVCTPVSAECNDDSMASCGSTLCYETEAPSAAQDRTCDAVLPECSVQAGTFEATPPGRATNRVCVVVKPECGQDSFESKAPTYSTDRECAPFTECAEGTFETIAPSPFQDRACELVSAICGEGTFEAVAPSAASDRKCTELTPACDLAFDEYEAVPPDVSTNRVCKQVNMCTFEEYEETAPTPSANRVCRAVAECSEDEFERTAATSASNRMCSTITPCIDGTYEEAAATATSDRTCVVWKRCSSGFFETVAPNKTADSQCLPCDGEYAPAVMTLIKDTECVDFLDELTAADAAEAANKKKGTAAIAAAVAGIVVVLASLLAL
jgi:hypothetical protein